MTVSAGTINQGISEQTRSKGRLVIFRSDSALAKDYRLGESGELVKSTSAQMTSGQFRVVEFGGIDELSSIQNDITTNEALCFSLPLEGSVSGRIVCQHALSSNPGSYSRSKACFGLDTSPGGLFIDHDAVNGNALDRDSLLGLLFEALPALSQAGILWRPSGSSHICNENRDLTGLKGQHLFALLADASDGPRIIKILAARLWLLGHGSIVLSKSGGMLVRCPIDTSPSDAARLIFAAGAVTHAPLEQRRGPPAILSSGGFLDSRLLIPDLTADETTQYETLVAQAKSARYAEAMAIRAQAKSKEVARRIPILMQSGASAIEADQRVRACFDAAYGRVLLGDFELITIHSDGRQETVLVSSILSNREYWHEKDFLSPLNHEHRRGSPDARAFLLGSSPIVYSFDGPEVFRLRHQVTKLQTAKGARGELVQGICKLLSEQDDIFMSAAGPVQMIDGRQIPITVARLQNIVGDRATLFAIGPNGKESPADLSREVAELTLANLI